MTDRGTRTSLPARLSRVPRALWFAFGVSVAAVGGAVAVLFGRLEEWS